MEHTTPELEAATAVTEEHTAADRVKAAAAVTRALAQLHSASASYENVASGIRDHDESYVLKNAKMSLMELSKLAAKLANEQRQIEPYVRTFKHRTWDVALAFARVYRDNHKGYGHEPIAVAGETSSVEIPVGVNKTVTIPYGTFELPELQATIEHSQSYDEKMGYIGQVIIRAPKMPEIQAAIRALCELVDEDLKVNSIYKGKAITSDTMPTFQDPYATDRSQIVWSRSVDAALRGSLLNVIKYTERARERGQKIHRSALFFGEPGNGKSETINIVAQECVENGWTYIFATGSLQEALQTARLLAPSVIAIEDFERLVDSSSAEERSSLLEELDGTSSKGKDIMLVSTTNFIGDLQKSVRRRMFKEIEFGAFDVAGTDKFLRIKLAGQTAPDSGYMLDEFDLQETFYTEQQRTTMDYPEVAKQMEGWGNSYISKVIDFAAGLALEHEDPALTTADLLDAVEAQRPDWEGYLASQSRTEPNKLDVVLSDVFAQAMAKVEGSNPQIGSIAFSEK